ncbi:MAG: polyphosphate kinase 2 family protein [Acidimicrobiia bacterium]|nr:polyphosphate kinase 2 family protein [Acidimicrobiia bacterium]
MNTQSPQDLDVAQYRVNPSDFPGLSSIDSNADGGLNKDSAKPIMKRLNERLEELQERLYAHGKERLLVVLQATDTGGKDGTIRAVFEHTNPQGVHVASFKKPTDEELSHDYLWRIHQHTPAAGDITIFNRSHYEDVLVVRVHELVEEARWRKRYEHIRNFEQMLSDEGTAIVKIYLHISKDEQKERLQARVDNPEKHWKFEFGDLKERLRWDDYQQAFEEMLMETSTDVAPWYVIPANRKWYRNIMISQLLVDTLEQLAGEKFEPNPELAGVVIE